MKKLYRLQSSQTLFLLCDVQEKFKPVMPLMNALIQNTQKLLTAGKLMNVPLLVTEQYPERLGKTVAELDIKHACAVIPKTKFSMLVKPLKQQMDGIFRGKPKTAVLFGLEASLTHICIEQTAFDLINNKVNVWLVADCCASRLNQDRDLALERLRDIGCIITSTESIIFNMLGDKDHQAFKSMAALVKNTSADLELWRTTKAPSKTNK